MDEETRTKVNKLERLATLSCYNTKLMLLQKTLYHMKASTTVVQLSTLEGKAVAVWKRISDKRLDGEGAAHLMVQAESTIRDKLPPRPHFNVPQAYLCKPGLGPMFFTVPADCNLAQWREQLLQDGKNPLDHFFDLASDVLLALHFMHKKKIVHKDLKPENFLVREFKGNRFTQIGDFGCAGPFGAADGWGTDTFRPRLYWAVNDADVEAGRSCTHMYELPGAMSYINQPEGDVWCGMMVLLWFLVGHLPQELCYMTLLENIARYPEREDQLRYAFGKAHTCFEWAPYLLDLLQQGVLNQAAYGLFISFFAGEELTAKQMLCGPWLRSRLKQRLQAWRAFAPEWHTECKLVKAIGKALSKELATMTSEQYTLAKCALVLPQPSAASAAAAASPHQRQPYITPWLHDVPLLIQQQAVWQPLPWTPKARQQQGQQLPQQEAAPNSCRQGGMPADPVPPQQQPLASSTSPVQQEGTAAAAAAAGGSSIVITRPLSRPAAAAAAAAAAAPSSTSMVPGIDGNSSLSPGRHQAHQAATGAEQQQQTEVPSPANLTRSNSRSHQQPIHTSQPAAASERFTAPLLSGFSLFSLRRPTPAGHAAATAPTATAAVVNTAPGVSAPAGFSVTAAPLCPTGHLSCTAPTELTQLPGRTLGFISQVEGAAAPAAISSGGAVNTATPLEITSEAAGGRSSSSGPVTQANTAGQAAGASMSSRPHAAYPQQQQEEVEQEISVDPAVTMMELEAATGVEATEPVDTNRPSDVGTIGSNRHGLQQESSGSSDSSSGSDGPLLVLDSEESDEPDVVVEIIMASPQDDSKTAPVQRRWVQRCAPKLRMLSMVAAAGLGLCRVVQHLKH